MQVVSRSTSAPLISLGADQPIRFPIWLKLSYRGIIHFRLAEQGTSDRDLISRNVRVALPQIGFQIALCTSAQTDHSVESIELIRFDVDADVHQQS